MNSLSLYLRIFSVVLLCLSSAPLAFSHGDAIPTDPGVAKDHFTVYGQSERYELSLYYPELKPGEDAHLRLFVADYQSNKPIDKASLKISNADGSALNVEVKAIAPGVYELHTKFPAVKTYNLNVQINHPNGADLIGIQGLQVGKALMLAEEAASNDASGMSTPWLWLLGGVALGVLLMSLISRRKRILTIVLLLLSAWFTMPNTNAVFAHGDEEHGPSAAGGSSFGTAVYTPKETQFLFEIFTQAIAIGDYQSAATVFGTIIPASEGLGVVVAPQAGRITKVNVKVGQKVNAGQVLAIMRQNIGTPDQVGIVANNAGLAVQIETAKTRLAAAKREYERLKKIEDIAAGRDIQAAEATYNAALAELQTLERQAVGANTSANSRTITLLAPISGVVGAFTLTPGSEVVAGQALLTVTNLNKVYVEAQVFDRDIPLIQANNDFMVYRSTTEHKAVKVRLLSPAQSMNASNQSQRVLFEMDNPQNEFKIGEFVTVKVLNQQRSRQLTVPNSALTEINGRSAVFIKHAPEEYELAYVQTGEDDGTRTQILKGLEESNKIVINGAYEVKMMYLNQ
ncbi:efflux RND transporter periplasmic adaptor subunit [Haliscomenobacter hydrossis]|uniref:Efflux transporter, RND family, MFP subunit n=1 Tax=Haliscomenobacter hydrossis (strain ATCC 27775 / DSM 1100 / LMG 10767 / O) TaxID=760192 RepID=F4L7T2_HALH1|nr:efflux RND transporter periplasmic adaptor subunit [Haliscomenobacter hydrossis]AEE54440.1 efflux transporter, RND family, MFP subunit [Haliscomenobacter hydrossis DSM 1100]